MPKRSDFFIPAQCHGNTVYYGKQFSPFLPSFGHCKTKENLDHIQQSLEGTKLLLSVAYYGY